MRNAIPYRRADPPSDPAPSALRHPRTRIAGLSDQKRPDPAQPRALAPRHRIAGWTTTAVHGLMNMMKCRHGIFRLTTLLLIAAVSWTGCAETTPADSPATATTDTAEIAALSWVFYPDVTTSGVVPLSWTVDAATDTSVTYYLRRMSVDQTSTAGPERFVTTTTVFADVVTRHGTYAYGLSALTDGHILEAATIVVVFAATEAAAPPPTTGGIPPSPPPTSLATVSPQCTLDAYDWVMLAGGSCIIEHRSSSAGADGIAGTTDDPELSRVALNEIDPRHRLWPPGPDALAARSAAIHPGLDGVYDTADDLVAKRNAPDDGTAPARSSLLYGSHLCLDDQPVLIESRAQFFRDAAQRVTALAVAGDPGPDATWFSADDDYAFVATAAWTGTTPVFARRFTDAGPDGTWWTPDDVTDSIQYWQWSGDSITRYTERSSPGMDGVWGTADDDGTEILYFYSGSSPVSSVARSLTDQTVLSGATYQADTSGAVVVRVKWLPGPDGQFPSADDQLDEAIRYDTCAP